MTKHYHTLLIRIGLLLMLSHLLLPVQAQLQQQRYLQLQPKVSDVKISKVYWINGKDTVNIEESIKTGLIPSDSLTLEVIFESESITKLKQNELLFDFRWYMSGATKRMLVRSLSAKLIDIETNPKQKIFSLSTSNKALSKGIWEIQIYAYIDRSFVTYKDIAQFKVLIK